MNKTRRLTVSALLSGLILLFGLTPVGLIPLGFINVTTLCLPVIIGTLIMGLKAGLLFGFMFGTVSLMSMLGFGMTPPSTLASNLFASLPLGAILMCYIPRLTVPVVAWLVYNSKESRIKFAAPAASFTNTVLYLGLMWAFYALAGLNTAPIVGLILGTGFLAGGAEALVAFLIVPPVTKALNKFLQKGVTK
ncbi:MAG: ECF transporter S component [Eubacteriales bacterium]|nr:ECF transporter S component [Eubacteriales bacterium]